MTEPTSNKDRAAAIDVWQWAKRLWIKEVNPCPLKTYPRAKSKP